MKIHSLPVTILLLMALFFVGCQNSESDRIRENARQTLPVIDPSTITAPAPTTPAASVNSNEPHYKCPNNCVGGVGASSGSCPVCGTELAHNQAYHNPAPSPTVTPSTPAASTPAAASAGGVFHYICSNGCAGGAASATACATCGNTLVHNQAYHSQGAGTTPAAPTISTEIPNFNPPASASTSNTSAPQNASGVFHYTCSNGCAGGAGSAVACATCGNTLVHNQAYHN